MTKSGSGGVSRLRPSHTSRTNGSRSGGSADYACRCAATEAKPDERRRLDGKRRPDRRRPLQAVVHTGHTRKSRAVSQREMTKEVLLSRPRPARARPQRRHVVAQAGVFHGSLSTALARRAWQRENGAHANRAGACSRLQPNIFRARGPSWSPWARARRRGTQRSRTDPDCSAAIRPHTGPHSLDEN